MEYGLDHRMPLYAGGLGILAGDILKQAHDDQLPLVGVGILWRQGYTWQRLGANGQPYDSYPNYDEIKEWLVDTGVTVRVDVRGRPVRCRVWKTEAFGNAPLFLLDTNLPENEDRWITGQLYGGFEEDRLAQEIVLGVGGVRALQGLGIRPDLYHFNEGHAVLAGLELIRQKMRREEISFHRAWQLVRRQIVFTTHTPVREGNESHRYTALGYTGADLGFTHWQLERLGGAPFNMTVAGLRLSTLANAVSQLHAQTARRMWQDVKEAAPIRAITNGVHLPTWQDRSIAGIPRPLDPEAVWSVHQVLKEQLIDFVADRTGTRLLPDRLLVGFGRRAAPYKRSDLIFHRPEVIDPLLAERKVQFVFSGKAHPLDDVGKDIVARMAEMARRYPQAVAFLENYDMEVAARMTRGADVWLNNPRRPLEASGTSGMKAAANGVLNLSILDGWWPEACQHGRNGWQFGDGYEGDGQDERDLDALYKVLLNEVIPVYYDHPARWKQMMVNAIELAQPFSTHRMLEQYYTDLYEPALREGMHAGPIPENQLAGSQHE
ncbi:MAG: alpha-glucan family phosphorylase [Limnochordaceae bacterium]|nr:alpha-glucan family phosphorylase [Limnochordaceae bacterium]